ncbi:MAG: hypothetical protein Q7S61_05160 [bacterium]|nr:hypothetical protein [bacterium]
MKRIKTTLLLGMVGFLLVATLYISMQLQQEQSPSSSTVIRQTKASSVTYRRTVNINAAEPTEEVTPVLSPSPEISLSPTISFTPPPGSITGTLLAQATSPIPSGSITPTEIILAKANLSTTLSATSSATVVADQKTKELPQSGWAQMTTLLFITASAFILFSFIF